MTLRQRLGLGFPPILLRLVLAATFIWAGTGKFFGPVTLTPDQAALLDSIHNGSLAPAPVTPPADRGGDADAETTASAQPTVLLVQQSQPGEEPPAGAAEPEQEPAEPTDTDTDTDTDADPDADTLGDAEPAPAHRMVDMVTLMIYRNATPNDEGKALLPGFMAGGKWPIWIANAVAVTELLGGIMILLGLLTRLWSLGIAGVMVGALWMTSIGPVVVMGAPGWPGFFEVLPAIDAFNPQAWQTWLWQASLIAGSVSLACLGSGAMSLDRLFFGKPGVTPAPSKIEHD